MEHHVGTKPDRLEIVIEKLAVYARLAAAGATLLNQKGLLTPQLAFRLQVEESFAISVLSRMIMLTNEYIAFMFDSIDKKEGFSDEVLKFCEALTGKKMSGLLVTPTEYEKSILNRKNRTLLSKIRGRNE